MWAAGREPIEWCRLMEKTMHSHAPGQISACSLLRYGFPSTPHWLGGNLGALAGSQALPPTHDTTHRHRQAHSPSSLKLVVPDATSLPPATTPKPKLSPCLCPLPPITQNTQGHPSRLPFLWPAFPGPCPCPPVPPTQPCCGLAVASAVLLVPQPPSCSSSKSLPGRES